EWSLAQFLVENLTQTQIKRFLALPWVLPFDLNKIMQSFTSTKELLTWMNSISSWPKWQCTTLDIEGYQTINPIQLIWHDAKEVIRSLFGNSIFDDDMMFD
ncbi:hypothetical protein SCLCIDRAFT_94368, partial [Scleroderma citrinum Foug A]